MLYIIRKSILIFVIIVMIICQEGYAKEPICGSIAYREGVLWGLDYHTGIVVQSNPLILVHIPGPDDYQKFCTLNQFLFQYRLVGMKIPRGCSKEQLLISSVMAREICNRRVGYSAYLLLMAEGEGQWVHPRDISRLRCDGLVEYVYEFYGIPMENSGANKNWDISKYTAIHSHSLPRSPRIQYQFLNK